MRKSVFLFFLVKGPRGKNSEFQSRLFLAPNLRLFSSLFFFFHRHLFFFPFDAHAIFQRMQPRKKRESGSEEEVVFSIVSASERASSFIDKEMGE